MRIAVCIVSFRNPDDVASCLEALSRSICAEFEVLICENGGKEAFESLRRRIAPMLSSGQPVTCLMASSNVGYAGGVNICMGHATDADAWWILNPDTIPRPEALARLCARLSVGDCGAVGCTLLSADGVVESRGGRWNPWLARAISIDHGQRGEAADIKARELSLSYLSGASMLVGRAMVEAVGLMREDFFLYGEEVEWCLRAAAAGVRLGLAADAEVIHHQGTTTGSVSDVILRTRTPVFLDERNKMLITRECFPKHFPVAAIGALAMLMLRFARRGAWVQTGYALAGWWDGLHGRRGRPSWIVEN